LASRSRLFEELLKILSTCRSAAILSRLQEHGLLTQFWPVLAQSWHEQEGMLARHLLEAQGRELQEGRLNLSKAMSLSCVSLPFLMSALSPGDMDVSSWRRDADSLHLAKRALRVLFEGYALPKYFQERVIGICFLLPRLLLETPSPKALQHSEYKYARKLLEFLCAYYRWDQSVLKKLPEALYRTQDDEEKQRRPRRKRRPGTRPPRK
ncbi:MAG: hypothetical protein WCS95_09245, partial [Lentisphaeria bacterium]